VYLKTLLFQILDNCVFENLNFPNYRQVCVCKPSVLKLFDSRVFAIPSSFQLLDSRVFENLQFSKLSTAVCLKTLHVFKSSTVVCLKTVCYQFHGSRVFGNPNFSNSRHLCVCRPSGLKLFGSRVFAIPLIFKLCACVCLCVCLCVSVCVCVYEFCIIRQLRLMVNL
jgi:hypothetical protein